MTTRFLSCLVALAALALPQPAGTASLEFEGRYWAPELSGELEVQTRGVGTRVDLRADLGIQDNEFPEGRLTLRPTRKLKLRAAFMPLSYAGDAEVARTIRFAGETFRLDTRVVSDLDLDYGRVGLAWQFIGFGRGAFRLGPLIEAKVLRGEVALSAPDLPLTVSVSEEFEVAFASAGLALDIEPSSRLHLFAEATGSVGIDEGDLRDAEAGIRYRPFPRLWVLAGYRVFELEAEEGDDFLDIEIEGVFFGLELRF